MASRIPHSDLLAGGIAAALLLLLALVFDVTPLIAILLAVAVYIGVSLLRPRAEPIIDPLTDEHRLAQESMHAHLVSVRGLESQVAKPDVRDQVHRIANRAEQVLAVIEEDRMLAAASLFNERLLEPFDVLLAKYIRLSGRRVKSAERLLEKAETHDLPMIERAVDTFYEKLHRGTLVDLATHGDMIELNIESLDVLPLRRPSP